MAVFSMSISFWVQVSLYWSTNAFQYEGLKNHKDIARLGVAFFSTLSDPALLSGHSGCRQARPNHSRPNSYKVQKAKTKEEESESLAHWGTCQKLTAFCQHSNKQHWITELRFASLFFGKAFNVIKMSQCYLSAKPLHKHTNTTTLPPSHLLNVHTVLTGRPASSCSTLYAVI